MNKLSTEKQTRVLAALVEGNSVRATVRDIFLGHAKLTHYPPLRFCPNCGTGKPMLHDLLGPSHSIPWRMTWLDVIWQLFVYGTISLLLATVVVSLVQWLITGD